MTTDNSGFHFNLSYLISLCDKLDVDYEYDLYNYNVIFTRKDSKNTSELLDILFGDKSNQLIINRNRFTTLVMNGWMEKILRSWAETGEIDLESGII